MRQQRQLLKHDSDRVGVRIEPAIDADRPGIKAVRPGYDPDQRRLAGSVAAQQRVDFATADPQIGSAQDVRGTKALFDLLGFEDECRGIRPGLGLTRG